jgi:hypothetical protein
MIEEQTICLPPRATAFTAVCEACRSSEERAGRSYVRATFDGLLPLEHELGHTLCRRGHRIRLVRATPAVR